MLDACFKCGKTGGCTCSKFDKTKGPDDPFYPVQDPDAHATSSSEPFITIVADANGPRQEQNLSDTTEEELSALVSPAGAATPADGQAENPQQALEDSLIQEENCNI